MLNAAGAGNPDSWVRMVRLYTPLVLYWCRRRFPPWQKIPPLDRVPDHGAEDVVQEVFLTVFKGIKTFTKDGEPAAFRRWLYAITRYKVLEYWGKQNGPAHGPDVSGIPIEKIPCKAPTPADSNGSPPPDLARLLKPIRSDWNAFWEHAVKGRSAEDVAKELGMPLSEIDSAKLRVLRCLREVAEDGTPVRVLLLRRLLELIRREFETRTWGAFLGVAYMGRSAEDVAEELHMRVGAVYTAKSRVLKRLREEAKAWGSTFPKEMW
jgi:RNA polymerase sigma-70 factor (ECF subfamily)